ADSAEEGWDELESFSKEINQEQIEHSAQVIAFLQTYDGVQDAYFQEVDEYELLKQRILIH
ncbi:MAG: hypothetical protein AAFR37_11945, partial [Cyanobacteria bacterium J06628_3]